MPRRSRGQEPPPSTPAAHGRRLLIGIATWFLLFGVARILGRPPGPLELDGNERRFSAERAAEILDRVNAGIGVHPSGSEAAAELLKRLSQELGKLGWEHQVQEAIGVGPDGTVGHMRNLVGRKLGRWDAGAILIAAHYDSVGAGPGISDDLASVAAMLEIARALDGDKLNRTVILLFSDGEEAGLVGAEAFASQHPWAQDVEVVLNLEARGVSGRSHMFQTGANNHGLVSTFASRARRPDASSVSVEVYRRLPNDTDFTVFLEHGWTGLNFAFIDDVYAYHTPLDDREHLNLASLQHQGEQVLDAVHELQLTRDLDRDGDAVYATLLGRFVGRTSVRSTRLIALLGCLGLLWALHRATRDGVLRWRQVVAGLVWVPICVALPVAIAFGYSTGMQATTGTAAPWHASPSPSWIALAGGLFLCTSWLGGLGRRLAGPIGLAFGVWAWWGLLGLFTAVFVSGASYLFAWPAFWMALVANGVRLREAVDARLARAAIFTIVLTVPLWEPAQSGLVSAFGLNAAPIALAVFALQATLLLPLFAAAPGVARHGVAGLGFACLVFGAVMTLILPHETRSRPGRLNLVYVGDGAGDRWQAWTFGAPLPWELEEALDWQPVDEDAPRWPGRHGLEAPAKKLPWPLPVFEDVQISRGEEVGEVFVEGHLRSFAYGARTTLEVHGAGGAAYEVLGVEVRRAGLESRHVGGRPRTEFVAPGDMGFGVRLRLRAPAPAVAGAAAKPDQRDVRIRLVDRVHGLPEEAAFLAEARGTHFVPSHDGDGLMLISELRVEVPPLLVGEEH